MYHEYIFADKKVTTKNINQYISMTESQRDSSWSQSVIYALFYTKWWMTWKMYILLYWWHETCIILSGS